MQIVNILKQVKILKNIVVFILDLPYKIHKVLGLSFNYKLSPKVDLKLFPEGQIARAIFYKWFERNEIKMFSNLIRPGMTVIDAGANIGLYSLIAGKLVGSKGKVISFEPSKETFVRFKNNINLNKLSNIIPVNCGLGDNPNEQLVLRQDIGNLDAERYLFPSNTPPSKKLQNINEINLEELIQVDTLDNYCFNNSIQKVDLMKIDTEGFEYYILKGAKNVLKNNPDLVILMECTSLGTARASTTQDDVFDLLRSFDFKIFYWNEYKNEFLTDDGIYTAGDIWVCKCKTLLNFSLS